MPFIHTVTYHIPFFQYFLNMGFPLEFNSKTFSFVTKKEFEKNFKISTEIEAVMENYNRYRPVIGFRIKKKRKWEEAKVMIIAKSF